MRGTTRRFGRAAAAVSALALAAGTATACSSSGTSGGGGGGAGSVTDTLKNIHTTAQSDSYIEYGDTAQIVKLSGGRSMAADSPFGNLLGWGSGQMADYFQVLPPLTGFDSTTATSAVTVGYPPNQISVLFGTFDPAAIGTKLAAWGYHKQDRGDGVTAWIFSDDHKLDSTKLDPSTGIGPGMTTGWLNVIWVSKTSIAYGGATSDLAAALPAQSQPLSKDAVVGPLADCLGPTLAAVLITSPKLIGSSAVPAIAFGVTGTSTADAREEICAEAPDDAGAKSLAAGFTKAVTSGHDYVQNEAWSKMLSDPQTTVIGGSKHVVQLSAKPVDPRLGLVFQLVEKNDFLNLLGLPEVQSGTRSPGGSVTLSPTADTGSDTGSETSSPSS